jgi:hypothetical protein
MTEIALTAGDTFLGLNSARDKVQINDLLMDILLREIDMHPRCDYCADMAKKKTTKKTKKNAFLGNLDRLGGKKLMQHGAEESARGKESRKHRVGAGRRRSG